MIGKYPIDLVAIMEDGSVEIVQFDGHYVHGDYNNPKCHTLPRYVGNLTRSECEEKTQERDQSTIDWMIQVQGDIFFTKLLQIAVIGIHTLSPRLCF